MAKCIVDNTCNMAQTAQVHNEEENDSEQVEDKCKEAENTVDSLAIYHSIYHVRYVKQTLQLGM